MAVNRILTTLAFAALVAALPAAAATRQNPEPADQKAREAKEAGQPKEQERISVPAEVQKGITGGALPKNPPKKGAASRKP